MASRGRRAVFAAFAVAGVVVAGCSADSSEPRSPVSSPGATTSDPAPTVSPAEQAEDDAIEAYLGMWRAMATAAETSDVQDHSKDPGEIARYAAGDALTAILRSLHTDYLNGVVTRGTPRNSPEVSSVDPPDVPTTIELRDCGDSGEWLKYKDGDPVDDEPGGRRSIIAEVQLQDDGSWRVVRFAVQGVGSC